MRRVKLAQGTPPNITNPPTFFIDIYKIQAKKTY